MPETHKTPLMYILLPIAITGFVCFISIIVCKLKIRALIPTFMQFMYLIGGLANAQNLGIKKALGKLRFGSKETRNF